MFLYVCFVCLYVHSFSMNNQIAGLILPLVVVVIVTRETPNFGYFWIFCNIQDLPIKYI